MTITTEWPEAGWHGECTCGPCWAWLECIILDENCFVAKAANTWLIRYKHELTNLQFRPLRTEREKAIESACNIVDAGDYNSSIEISFALRKAIEDLIDAGFRLPEGDGK